MANPNYPHGLMPLGTSLSGGPQTIEEYTKPSSDTHAIYRYDPVQLTGGNLSANGITPGTQTYSGVALNYAAGSKKSTHSVIVSTDAIFETQYDSTVAAAADIGKNANLTLAVDGGSSLPPNLSAAVLNGSTVATTSTLDVHIFGLYQSTGTAANGANAFGAYARVEVVFNKHRMNGGVAGL
jgi:hypothetical protein